MAGLVDSYFIVGGVLALLLAVNDYTEPEADRMGLGELILAITVMWLAWLPACAWYFYSQYQKNR